MSVQRNKTHENPTDYKYVASIVDSRCIYIYFISCIMSITVWHLQSTRLALSSAKSPHPAAIAGTSYILHIFDSVLVSKHSRGLFSQWDGFGWGPVAPEFDEHEHPKSSKHNWTIEPSGTAKQTVPVIACLDSLAVSARAGGGISCDGLSGMAVGHCQWLLAVS